MAISTEELLVWFEKQLPSLIQITFSISESTVQKVVIRQVFIQKKPQLQITSFEKTKCTIKNKPRTDFEKELVTLLHTFKHAFIRTNSHEYYVEKTIHNCWKMKTKKLQEEVTCELSHNRKKKHIIEEGKHIECLEALGIMTADGKVRREARDKFKQIQHFSELVFDLLPHFEKKKEKTLRIVDLGCGKAYLSFALYHLLTTNTKYTIELVGVDRKNEVIDLCNDLAKKMGYDGLSFTFGTISEYSPTSSIDIVIALHACNTATDEAIFQAVKWRAEAIFVAPCCQHELAKQMKSATFPLLTKHGLFREQFASLVTDAIRAELLSTIGYKVDVCEFVDPTHTPKNILLRAVKIKSVKKEGQRALSEEYKKLKEQLGIQPTLERLLFQSY